MTDNCDTCGGVGSKVLRINRRRNGTISSVTYSLKEDCPDCKGTGKVRDVRAKR